MKRARKPARGSTSRRHKSTSRKDGTTVKVSQQEAQEIITEFDKDGDGLLSFEEFMDAMADM